MVRYFREDMHMSQRPDNAKTAPPPVAQPSIPAGTGRAPTGRCPISGDYAGPTFNYHE